MTAQAAGRTHDVAVRSDWPPQAAVLPRAAPRIGERGFTLLEVLVAFAIATIALAVLYHGAADGLLGSRLAARTDEAVARARSRLTALCHGAPLPPGEQSGDDGGGYVWRTQINRTASETVARPAADQTGAGRPGADQIGANQTGANQTGANQTGANQSGADPPGPPMRADLFAVRVTVSWPGPARSHQVSLETRCLSVGAANRP